MSIVDVIVKILLRKNYIVRMQKKAWMTVVDGYFSEIDLNSFCGKCLLSTVICMFSMRIIVCMYNFKFKADQSIIL